MEAPARTRRTCFGAFEVDLRAGEVYKHGVRLKLQDQPFQVLVVLLEHAGDVVTREELRQKLWPADTFVDFDTGLNSAIKKLRDVLADSAEEPCYIETLPRRGYRFIAPLVKPIGAPVEVQNPSPTLPERSTPRIQRRVAALIAVLFVCILIWAVLTRRGASGARHIESIAILPLENLSHDPEQEYFSDGMTSAIIGTISEIRPLRVISRTSTERYKGTKKSLPEIAKELGVDAVIEGSVLRAGDRVRIDVELIDGATDKHLWSQSYERELGDVLRLDGELARDIASQIQVQIAPDKLAKFHAVPRVNQAAYEEYLKGRLYSLALLPSQNQMAREHYEKSIEQDPSFALAYAGLADSYIALGMQRRIPPREAARLGNEYVRHALRLDPDLGEAHSALADLLWQFEWNWQQADAEYRKAVSLSSSYRDAHQGYAWFLSWSGRRDEALAEVAATRRIDPTSFDDESGLHYHFREYSALVESAQKIIALSPGDWVGHYFLGVGSLALGKKEIAIGEFQKAVELSQNDSDAVAALAYALAVSGKRALAEKILADLENQAKTAYVSPYMIAVIYAGLGEKDRAFQFLEASYAEKSCDLAYFIKADLRLDALRPDPRFANLVARVAPPDGNGNSGTR